MSKEISNQTEKKQWTFYRVMQRTWKVLLIEWIEEYNDLVKTIGKL